MFHPNFNSTKSDRSKFQKDDAGTIWFQVKRMKAFLESKSWLFFIFALVILFSIIAFGVMSVPNHPPDKTNVPEVELILSGLESLSSLPPEVSPTHDSESNGENWTKEITFSPFLEKIQERDVVWQIPANPVSVLFIAHGCGQEATYFFDQHPNCTICNGMPEDRVIAMDGLLQDYAVIAIKSLRPCWDAILPMENSIDVLPVAQILKEWREKHGLSNLPLDGIGISSGGNFLSVLVHALPFHSISLYISSGIKEAFMDTKDIGKFPPTLFVHMPRDRRTARAVRNRIRVLTERHVESAEIKCSPFSISKKFFSKRIVGMNNVVSTEIFDALKTEKYLDEKNFLLQNPRESNWRAVIKKYHIVPIMKNKLLKWEREIAEELNLAYAYHEMTSLKSSETFDWFKRR